MFLDEISSTLPKDVGIITIKVLNALSHNNSLAEKENEAEARKFKKQLIKTFWKLIGEEAMKEGIDPEVSRLALTDLTLILMREAFGKEMASYIKKAIISVGNGYSIYSSGLFLTIMFHQLKRLPVEALERQISFFNPTLKTFKDLIGHLEANYHVTSAILISLLELKKQVSIIAEDLVRTADKEDDFNDLLNKFDELDEAEQLEKEEVHQMDETLSTEKSQEHTVSSISTQVSKHELMRLRLVDDFRVNFKREDSDEESYKKVFSTLLLSFRGKSYFDVMEQNLNLFSSVVMSGEVKVTGGMVELIVTLLLQTQVSWFERKFFFEMFAKIVKCQYLSQEAYLQNDSLFFLLKIVRDSVAKDLSAEGFELFNEIFICLNSATNNIQTFNHKITDIQDINQLAGLKILWSIFLENKTFLYQAKKLLLNIISVVSESPKDLSELYDSIFENLRNLVDQNNSEKCKRVLQILYEARETSSVVEKKLTVTVNSQVSCNKGVKKIEATSGTSILQLKKLIKEEFDDGIELPLPDPNNLQLLYKGKLLKDSQSLGDLKYETGGMIIVAEGYDSEIEIDDETLLGCISLVKNILPDMEEEVIKIGLKKNSYNTENTAIFLLEPENVDRIKKELEEESKVKVKETVNMLNSDRLNLLLSLSPSKDEQIEEAVWQIIKQNSLPVELTSKATEFTLLEELFGGASPSQQRLILMLVDDLVFGEKSLRKLPEVSSQEKIEKKTVLSSMENMSFLVNLLLQSEDENSKKIMLKWLKEQLVLAHFLIAKEKTEWVLKNINSRVEKVIDFTKDFSDSGSRSDSNKTPQFGASKDSSFDYGKKKTKLLYEGDVIDIYLDEARSEEIVQGWVGFGFLNSITALLKEEAFAVDVVDILLLFAESNNQAAEIVENSLEPGILAYFTNPNKNIRRASELLLSSILTKITDSLMVDTVFEAFKGTDEYSDEFYSLVGKLVNSPKAKYSPSTLFEICTSYPSVPSPAKKAGYFSIISILLKSSQLAIQDQQAVSIAKDLIQGLFEISEIPDRELFYGCLFKDVTLRNKAFSLLATIYKLSAPVQLMVHQKIAECNFDSPLSEETLYSPIASASQTLLGLRNYGCTCYINSLMQQLEKVGLFRKILTENLEKPLVRQAAKVIYQMRHSQCGMVHPLSLISRIELPGGERIDTRQQQDAEEFMNILLERLEEEVGAEKLNSLFRVIIGSETISLEENYPYYSLRKELNLTLSIEIKNKKNFNDSLAAYVRGEVLDGDNKYKIEEFDTKVSVLRRSSVYSLSDNLIVHLKRFDFCYTTFSKLKLNDRFEFPMEFDFSEFHYEKVKTRDNRGFYDREKAKSDSEKANMLYKLTGILIHSGTTEGGHYYSLVKENGVWWKCDDSQVTEFDERNIPSECFGGQQGDEFVRNPTAYLLFYTRKEEEMSVVNQELLKEISADNKQFMEEKIYADQDFTTFLSEVASNGKEINYEVSSLFKKERVSDNCSKVDEKAYRAGKAIIKYFLNIADQICSPNKVLQMAHNILSLLGQSIGLCTWLLKYFCKNKEYFLRLIVTKKSDYADSVCYLVSKCLDRLYFHEQQNAMNVVNIGDNQVPLAISMRFFTTCLYPAIIQDVDPEKAEYLVRMVRNTLKYYSYTSFIISQSFPNALINRIYVLQAKLGNTIAPSLIDILSILVRSTITRGITNGQKFSENSRFQQEPPISMNHAEEEALRSADFLVNVMAASYDQQSVAEILEHLCWYDLEQTKEVLECMISAIKINRYDIGVTMRLLRFFEGMLKIKDCFTEDRVNLTLDCTSNGLVQSIFEMIGETDILFNSALYLNRLADIIDQNTQLQEDLTQRKDWVTEELIPKLNSLLEGEAALSLLLSQSNQAETEIKNLQQKIRGFVFF